MTETPEWMSCGSRSLWVKESLKSCILDMRKKETNCHRARTDWMIPPANYLADVYGEVAALLKTRLAELEAIPARIMQGDGE